jgi:FtsP/CotA-like multicopper oxidase with cupredoxin domain
VTSSLPPAGLSRRHFTRLTGFAAAALLCEPGPLAAEAPADFTLEIAPFLLETSPKKHFQTIAYNGRVPGPLLRMRQGRPVTVDVHNRSADPEVVHWHGLYLPPAVDGAMEEGTPMIPAGGSARYTFTPDPAGFRWFHTHTFAGSDLRKAQYGGQHGFLMVDPATPDPTQTFDREIFLALHDWGGRDLATDDGSMNPTYQVATINGKMLGFGEPIRVKQGERILLHVLNSSPTEVHWIAFSGHRFQVIALDGNPVPVPRTVDQLRLAPAERVSALVEMNAPGLWILGEVRKHVQAAGMGIVFEYANATGTPRWIQPPDLLWNYRQFATPVPKTTSTAQRIELNFDSKFRGHGAEEQWLINGKSWPNTAPVIIEQRKRYRLVLQNHSADDHPLHLHRHTFEVRSLPDGPEIAGLLKDVVLVPAKSTVEVEFTANHPGNTLFHCHQQNHMDRGFMMVFQYA